MSWVPQAAKTPQHTPTPVLHSAALLLYADTVCACMHLVHVMCALTCVYAMCGHSFV
jgi:hypothetical protein